MRLKKSYCLNEIRNIYSICNKDVMICLFLVLYLEDVVKHTVLSSLVVADDLVKAWQIF